MRVFYLIGIVTILGTFTGCKSKKKAVERTKTQVQTQAEVKTFEAETVKTARDSIAKVDEKTYTVSKDEFIQIESKQDTVTVEKETTKSGGTKLKITGAANVTIGKNETKREATVKATVEVQEKVKRDSEAKVAIEVEQDATEKTRQTDTEIKGKFPWWIVIVAGIAVLLFLLIRWYIKNFRFRPF